MKRSFGLVGTWIVLALSLFFVKADGAETSKEDHLQETNNDEINLALKGTSITKDALQIIPNTDEQVAYFNMTTTTHRKLISLSQAKQRAEQSKGYKGLRKYGSYNMKNHLRGGLIKILGGSTCKKTGDFNCEADYSPLKTNCNLGISNFCAENTKACVLHVVDIALDVLDILSNFFPPAKVLKAVKTIAKVGTKGVGRMVTKAKQAVMDKVKKEVMADMIESVAKKFSKEELAKTFLANNMDSSIVWLVNLVVAEAVEELATGQVVKEFSKLKGPHGKSNLAKEGLTRQEEEREALNLLAEFDPTGVFSVLNKLFLGPKCNEKMLHKKQCKFGGPIWVYEKALEECCAGVQNPGRRRFLAGGSRTSRSGRDKTQDQFGNEVQFKPGQSSCNLASGEIGCNQSEGPVIAVLPTDFADAQLRYLSKTEEKTMGIYFHVPSSSKALWNKLFGAWHESTHCHVDWGNMMKDKCLNDDDEFSYHPHDRALCINIAENYYKRCEINSYGPDGNPHEVRQCRDGETVWEGRIMMYSNWHGRRFGYDASNDDWESGDMILPISYCCPKTGYNPPSSNVSGCGRGDGSNNKYWNNKMIRCDWVGKNPYHRCEAKSSHGVLASDPTKGCRDACQCRNKPSIEPDVGGRVEGVALWGSKPHAYFLIKRGTWAWTVWKEMAIESVESVPNEEGQSYKMYEMHHCRNGKSLYQGFFVVFSYTNEHYGRYPKNKLHLNRWLDGDVVIPVGADFRCEDTKHQGVMGTYTPTKAAATKSPTKKPTKKPTDRPTSPPTRAPDNPPYGVRITAGSFWEERPWPDREGRLRGRYFCVDEDYRDEKFREMCFDSKSDQLIKRKEGESTEIKLCRNGIEKWKGEFKWYPTDWCSKDINSPLYDYSSESKIFQDGDVIIISTEDCRKTSSKTNGSLGDGKRCPKQTPGTPTRAPTACYNPPYHKTHSFGIIVGSGGTFDNEFCIPPSQKVQFRKNMDKWETEEWVICRNGYYVTRGYVDYDFRGNTGSFKHYRRVIYDGDLLYPFSVGGYNC